MNAKHKLGMIMMMGAMMGDMNSPHNIPTIERQSTPQWKRKKCKSCKHLGSSKPCYNGKYVTPKSNACNKYSPKNKNYGSY